MLIKKPADLPPSEITPPELYVRRREFLKSAAALGVGALLSPLGSARPADEELKPTPYKDITSYNNFVELGSGKAAPALYGGNLRAKPWTVTVEGHCEKPGQFGLEDFLKPHAAQER
ncbi:MAG TPA: mononuclear molybdenum enzyme YedY, partial [Candidatus Competibacteraceae bacterium]|nr:mononuclear molybdenum enzyme YedY [Candidatus Competibacteraceae bacterium]